MNGQVTISLEDFRWLDNCETELALLKRILQRCCIMEGGEHYSWPNRNAMVVDIEITKELKKFILDEWDEEMHFSEDLVNEVENENRKEN